MHKHKNVIHMNRRKFIAQSSLLGAAIFTRPIYNDQKDLDRLVAETFGIDTHNHVDVPFLASEFVG